MANANNNKIAINTNTITGFFGPQLPKHLSLLAADLEADGHTVKLVCHESEIPEIVTALKEAGQRAGFELVITKDKQILYSDLPEDCLVIVTDVNALHVGKYRDAYARRCVPTMDRLTEAYNESPRTLIVGLAQLTEPEAKPRAAKKKHAANTNWCDEVFTVSGEAYEVTEEVSKPTVLSIQDLLG